MKKGGQCQVLGQFVGKMTVDGLFNEPVFVFPKPFHEVKNLDYQLLLTWLFQGQLAQLCRSFLAVSSYLSLGKRETCKRLNVADNLGLGISRANSYKLLRKPKQPR